MLKTVVCVCVVTTLLLANLMRVGDWRSSSPRPLVVMQVRRISAGNHDNGPTNYINSSNSSSSITNTNLQQALPSSGRAVEEKFKVVTDIDLGPPASFNQSEFDILLTQEIEVTRGQIWVKHQAPLLSRIEFYNGVLAVYRQRTRTVLANSSIDTSKWLAENAVVSRVYWNQSAFLSEITAEAATTTTLYLQYLGQLPLAVEERGELWDSRSSHMIANILLQQYYDWNGSTPLCDWLIQDRWQWDFLRASVCVAASRDRKRGVSHNLNLQHSSSMASAQPTSVGAYLYQEQMIGGPGSAYLSYVHIVQWGTVTSEGHVFVGDPSTGSSYKLVTPVCFPNRRPEVKVKADISNYYDEVFSICQSLGQFYYHNMVEQLPRLAPFITFLRRFPTIRIHIAATSFHTDILFRDLDLDPSRLVTGGVRARIVYVPRSTPCGRMRLNEGQLLSHHYRQYIAQRLIPANSMYPQEWNSVVLIQRSGRRRFRYDAEIRQKVSTLAQSNGFTFELFADNPTPSAEDTMLMFYRARVVVGPHGAGLSNTMFSRPGTFVIEGICEYPHTNVCYLQQTYELGLVYHGVPSRGGCDNYVDANPSEIVAVLGRFLYHIRNNQP